MREARQTDRDIKKRTQIHIQLIKTYSRYEFKIGDQVLLRNYKRKSKFDSYYLLEKLCNYGSIS